MLLLTPTANEGIVMRKQRGSIYLYMAALSAIGWWVLMGDEYSALSEVLKGYQQDSDDNKAEAQLAIALTRVVEKKVRPSLMKKLRPQDVDDTCSEVVLGFWQFRHSVRSDETAKLVNTLVQRRLNDQLRGYYKDAEHLVREQSEEERELLELLPSRGDEPGTEADQDVWELLCLKDMNAADHLVAYMVFLGLEKQVITEVLGLSASTVTRRIKRCREVFAECRPHREAGSGA